MKKTNKNILCAVVLMLSTIAMTACGMIEVRGKTFVYESVEIDWGMADDEDKQALYEEFLVSNETELLNVLKTRNNRNKRITTFGTDSKYTTVNLDNEILDSGFYKQDDDVVTLAETEEGFADDGNYTLKVNDKGYLTKDVLNSELSIFAVYQYVINN
jgi:hypothetical protein